MFAFIPFRVLLLKNRHFLKGMCSAENLVFVVATLKFCNVTQKINYHNNTDKRNLCAFLSLCSSHKSLRNIHTGLMACLKFIHTVVIINNNRENTPQIAIKNVYYIHYMRNFLTTCIGRNELPLGNVYQHIRYL